MDVSLHRFGQKEQYDQNGNSAAFDHQPLEICNLGPGLIYCREDFLAGGDFQALKGALLKIPASPGALCSLYRRVHAYSQ